MTTKSKKAETVKEEIVKQVTYEEDMYRPIRVKVNNLESTLPVYTSWHFDSEKQPGFKAIESGETVTLPLGAVIDLLKNQTVFNEKPKYDLQGNIVGTQGANHVKYSVQLLDAIDDKYLEHAERSIQARKNPQRIRR